MRGKWKQLKDDILLKTLCIYERKWHELRENLKIKHRLQIIGLTHEIFFSLKFGGLNK